MIVMISSEEYRDLVIKANKYDELMESSLDDVPLVIPNKKLADILREDLKNMKEDK